MTKLIQDTIDSIKPLNQEVMARAREHLDSRAKPVGSLGKLEEIAVKISGMTGEVGGNIDKKIHFVLGADNGIYDEGVAAAPQVFTSKLFESYADGKPCGINVLCNVAGVHLVCVDMGIKYPLKSTGHLDKKLMNGTENFAKIPAMTRETAEKAIEIGIELALQAAKDGYKIIGTGEVGMGNTSTSSACLMALTAVSADVAVGRGAGLSDEAFEAKKAIITKGVCQRQPVQSDSIDILAKVGGLDLAAMTGLFLGGAACGIPVIVDGFISAVAALCAVNMWKNVANYMIASHISEEPGFKVAMDGLGLSPMLDLNMRLGEGTGCPIAMQIIDGALRISSDMMPISDLM